MSNLQRSEGNFCGLIAVL